MDNYITDNGFDTRNYGELEGLPEARALFADVFGVQPGEVFVGGNSSLQLIDRKSTRLNSSHSRASRMPSSA